MEKKKIVGKIFVSYRLLSLYCCSCIDILRFAILGDKTCIITFALIAVVFIFVAYTAGKAGCRFCIW